MSTPVNYNGVSYQIPQFGDVGYAQGPGNLSSYLIALAGGPQTTGGLFSLTAPLNFGPNFGLIAVNYTSTTANPATAGQIRLAKTDTIDWRNNANTLNLPLGINGTDQLTFNGVVLSTAAIAGTVNAGTQFQLAYYAATGNAISGLTLITPSRALASDANGLPVASATTAAELAFVNGVTSAIQTQINAKANLAGPNAFTGTNTFSGGAGAITLSASTIAMGANKITGLANGTAATDAAAFGQIGAGFQAPVMGTSTTIFATTSASFQPSNCIATITPTSASHRIKITVTTEITNTNIAVDNLHYSLSRGSTDIGAAANKGFGSLTGGVITGVLTVPVSVVFIDSPATVSATTYKFTIRNEVGVVIMQVGASGSMQVMVLEEIV